MDGDRFGGPPGEHGGDPPPPRRRRESAGGAHAASPAEHRAHPEPDRRPPSYQLAGQPPGGYPGDGVAGLLAPMTGTDQDRAERDGGRRGGGGPSRRVVLTTLAVTALVAVLAGGLWGFLRPAAQTVTTLTGAPSSPAATGSATTKPAATSAATTSATKSATATQSPRDTAFVDNPAGVKGMDFGLLRGISRSGGTVTLRVDRAQFLTGSAAAKYYAKNPDLEPLDYAIVNTNRRLRSFPLTDDAAVYAEFALGDGASIRTQEIGTDQLVTKARALLDQKQTVLLWLRHTKEPDGPVYYVAEQYTP